MDALEMRQRGRGRPAGSRKPATELRQRRDYRFSPATVHQIEQGRQLAQTTETAFVEVAIQQYVSFLIAKEADSCEIGHHPDCCVTTYSGQANTPFRESRPCGNMVSDATR